MAFVFIQARPAVIDGALPYGWQVDDGAGADLRLVAQPRASGDRPTATVRVRAKAAEPIEDAAGHLLEQVAQVRPERVIANCDVWPHPVWGIGRLVQTAYLRGEKTMAHDVYLFVDGPLEIRVEVDCELVSLLAIEEQVATIVARIRTDAHGPQGGTR